LSQNVVHSDSDLILHNSSVLIDKEPTKVVSKSLVSNEWCSKACICSNKPKLHKNLRSNFRKFLLIS
ncbi:hypothetical protein EWI08_14100, partial [Enterococcus faecium]